MVHSLNQGGGVAVGFPSSEISRGFEVHNSSFIEEDFRFELMIQSLRLLSLDSPFSFDLPVDIYP